MTPHALIIATLGNGPGTETLLLSKFIARGDSYESARLIVTNTLCDLLQNKQIEMPMSGVYRLTAGMAPMEGSK
jgi:hypothetical protein